MTGITSATSYERAMRLIAERMDVGPSRMAAIGYIPSYKPKSPKPVAKLLEDEEAWDRLIEDIRAYIDSFAIKRGASRSVKPFVISIVDTLGVDPKESKVCFSLKLVGPVFTCNFSRARLPQRRRRGLTLRLNLRCPAMKVIKWTS